MDLCPCQFHKSFSEFFRIEPCISRFQVPVRVPKLEEVGIMALDDVIVLDGEVLSLLLQG